MTPEQWRRVSAIFHSALAKPHEDQVNYLDEACDAQPAVRTEVERLLTAHRNAGSFGDEPAYRDLLPPPTAHADFAPVETRRRWPFLLFVLAAAIATVAAFLDAAWLLAVSDTRNAVQLVYFIVSLVWCAVGLFIGFARPDAVLARLACATALAVGSVFLEIGVIQSAPLWAPLHGVLGFHFLARFPTGRPTQGLVRVALVVAYVGGAFAVGLGMMTHALLVRYTSVSTLQFINEYLWIVDLRVPLGVAAFAIAVLGMIFVLVHNYRHLINEDHRRRVRWVFLGAIAALVPQLWWIVVKGLELASVPTPFSRFDLFVNAFTVTIPLTMAYAVVKHRVLDIRVVIRRGVRYLLARRALQAASLLPFVMLLYELVRNRDRTLVELAAETSAYIFWLVLAFAALKFRHPIAAWLDGRFFREEYDREQLMIGLLDTSRHVESLSDLSLLVSDTLVGAMHPSKAFVWYRDPRERLATTTADPVLVTPDFPASPDVLLWLEQQNRTISLSELQNAGLSQAATLSLADGGIDVVVPLADSSDRLIGALLLGEKKSEEPYDENDSRFLHAVAKQTAAIHENVRLRERLSKELKVRHDVLARIDSRMPELLKECPACGACFDGVIERCPDDDQILALTLPVERTIQGRYRLDRLIGRGGMGAVYEAGDLQLNRTVAVKIMLARGLGQSTTLRRFRREARVAAGLNHPNIVIVYDIGSLEGEGAYIVMERIRGETLRAVLDRERVLLPQVAGEWFEPMLAGIAAAHASGIVHRDLKPENVMGNLNDLGKLDVKVLDLGLAKFRSSDPQAPETVTQEGLIMGTPDYMSPEQLLGHEVDHRADIFAVGVMLLETLTGKRDVPDGALTGSSPMNEVFADSWPSRALRDLVKTCLAADPNDRPVSATALAELLLPALRASVR